MRDERFTEDEFNMVFPRMTASEGWLLEVPLCEMCQTLKMAPPEHDRGGQFFHKWSRNGKLRICQMCFEEEKRRWLVEQKERFGQK